jgi:hypothetical protein
MRRRRSRRRGSSRRRFLLYAGGVGATLLGATAASNQTGAFSSIDADRISTANVASDDQGIVGIVELANQGTVKKNDREPMVEITNNASEVVTYDITLDTCNDGTLYDNDGGSGCSVTFDLLPGNSQFVDIRAEVTGAIGYSITTSGGVSLETSRSIDAESGNIRGNVDIQKPVKDQSFTAVPPRGNRGNVFEIKSVDIRDNSDTNIGLAEIEYEVREGGSGGRLVAEKTVIPPNPDRYKPNGNPAETIEPNDGETIQSGKLYALRTRAENNAGDFDSETVEDTA